MDIERVNIAFNYDMPEDSDTYLHRVSPTSQKGIPVFFPTTLFSIFSYLNLLFLFGCLPSLGTSPLPSASFQVARAGRFGTKGLAITFVSDENDAKILNDVQDRFEVNISELPDEIDISSYSEYWTLGTGSFSLLSLLFSVFVLNLIVYVNLLVCKTSQVCCHPAVPPPACHVWMFSWPLWGLFSFLLLSHYFSPPLICPLNPYTMETSVWMGVYVSANLAFSFPYLTLTLPCFLFSWTDAVEDSPTPSGMWQSLPLQEITPGMGVKETLLPPTPDNPHPHP